MHGATMKTIMHILLEKNCLTFHNSFAEHLLPCSKDVRSCAKQFQNNHLSYFSKARFNSEMSHPRCVYTNNRCMYQSIKQYIKRCLIKDDSNYMFRPISAIIRFSSESMLVVLYRIGMVMSRW